MLLTCDPELPVPPSHYGGVQRIVAEIVEGLGCMGLEIALLAHPESNASCKSHFSWPVNGSQGTEALVKNTLALQRAVFSFQPQLIHSFSRLAFLTLQLPTRIPKIMSYQRAAGSRQVALASMLARESLQFTGCSAHISQSGARAGGNWRTIHNFVDLDKFQFIEQASSHAPLVFLSRLERIKGVHNAIKIAKSSGRRLIIAGNRYYHGASAQYFRNEIEPELKPGLIDYIGEVNDAQKNELLGQAAALLVPIEWQEPFGIVFIEALACGTPVISTCMGAVPEIIEDGKHGFIIDSIEQGIQAVSRLSEISRRECRERVEKYFCSSVVIQQYRKLYESLLGIGSL